MDPHVRLEAFLAWIGWSDAELARRIGCHQTHVSRVRRRERRGGLRFALGLERVTKEFSWPDGPIRAEEWLYGSEAAA